MGTSVYQQVKAINDEYRTAGMNRKYYACRLRRLRRIETTLEILLAVGTSGAVATWSIWKDPPGDIVWKVLGAAVTLLAVVKPFLQLPREIERYSELATGYGTLFYDYDQILLELRTGRSVSSELWSRFCSLRDRNKELGIKDDLPARKRLLRRCYVEINNEIPIDSLWWPDDDR